MAGTRYGQIVHDNNHKINLRFASGQAREEFRGAFEEYHASHEHDGEVPRFINITAKDANSVYVAGTRNHGTIHPVKLVVLSNGEFVLDHNEQAYRVTIDGYTFSEIKDYHNPSGLLEYSWYHPPTSCVPPIIVVGNKFVDSSILTRHELSAFFRDMSDEEYQALLASVEKNGFIDNIIRVYEGQILDGWHRYRAGRELNLLRKLKFQEWNEDEHRDGDPRVFAYARNMDRRHYSPSQRAQVAVAFNERFGHGGDRSNVPNGTLKTREELAKEVGVGTSTISRAVAVEKEGESEAVISGEKTAGEVLLAKDRETAKQAETEMWEAFRGIEEKVSRDDFKRGACRHHTNWGVEDIPAIEDMKWPKVWKARFDLLNSEIRAQVTWIKALIGEDTEISPLAHKLRQIVRPEQAASDTAEASEDDAEKAEALAKFHRQKRDLYARIDETRLVQVKDEFGNINSDKARHKVMLAAYGAYNLDENLLWSEQAIEVLSVEEISNLTSKYFLMVQDFTAPRADWVAELYQELDVNSTAGKNKTDDRSLNDRMDRCRVDLLEVWQQEEVSTWEGLEIQAYVEEYGLSADVIGVMQSEIAAEHPKPPEPCEPETDSNEDTSLADIDNLPAVKHFLESLLKQVGQVEHQPTRDDFSVCVFDVLIVDSKLTEREQLSILIDCALNLVAESM
ncbi:MAG: ParB/RepB/Spo0J family partition protein [Candidatus Poribacteria bacterium]|nr:ParB/RepB/Spo0J family partition protein [Candidatus Poribacteria bacterium]